MKPFTSSLPLWISILSQRYWVAGLSEDPDKGSGVLKPEPTTVNNVLQDFKRIIMENDIVMNTTDLEISEPVSATKEELSTPSKPRLNCTFFNRTLYAPVVILNGTELQLKINEEVNSNVTNRTFPGTCSVTLFYATWCEFSAEAAPSYNALPHFFPGLNFYAIEAASNLNIFAQFGVVALPSLIVFHNGRPMYGYNHSEPSLKSFVEFISSLTGIPPTGEIESVLDEMDLSGPVPSVVVKPFNYNLVFALLFLAACAIVELSKSASFRNVIDNLRNAWREVEIQHEHVD